MTGVDAARESALEVVRAVRERGAYANLLLPDTLRRRGITGRDAAFATALAYGTLRRQGSYDRIAAACVDRPWSSVDPAVRDVIALGCHQLLGMEVPVHAAVDTSVELVKRQSPRAAGFVNAVLRRVGRSDYAGWIEQLIAPDAHPHEVLGLRHAHPRWIVDGFADSLAAHGAEAELEKLLEADNQPPVVTLVARPGRCELDELVEAGARPGRWSPLAAQWPSGDPGALAAVREHRAGVQDEGSQLVALALAAAPLGGSSPAGSSPGESSLGGSSGESSSEGRWLDMCAGPGGKAALLAALAHGRGAHLTAWELQLHRARLVRRAVGPGADVEVVDAADPARVGEVRFDRVLLDAPCSGTGALRRRPEARWRKRADDLPALVDLQRRLLANALRLVRPGGVVAYVTCSPLLAETREVLATVAGREDVEVLDARPLLPASMPGLGAGPDVQLWPHRHGTDAMYLALLRRC